jgi:hypothetical protein
MIPKEHSIPTLNPGQIMACRTSQIAAQEQMILAEDIKDRTKCPGSPRREYNRRFSAQEHLWPRVLPAQKPGDRRDVSFSPPDSHSPALEEIRSGGWPAPVVPTTPFCAILSGIRAESSDARMKSKDLDCVSFAMPIRGVSTQNLTRCAASHP